MIYSCTVITLMPIPYSLDLARLAAAYAKGVLAPSAVVGDVYDAIAGQHSNPVWIHLLPENEVAARARALERRRTAGDRLPLYGVPFAVKDNIDVAGFPTTAACPAYAYTATATARAVERLQDAGALLIGKTNLDQFATGLVGTRSPYGACFSPFDRRYIAGGSSSGSALAVATGIVSFALGTDTMETAKRWSAVDAFAAQYRLREIGRRCEEEWARMDVLAVPTTGTIPTIADVAAAPIESNTRLGYYTNFVNLLDLAAIAVPGAFRADGLPAGVTLIAQAHSDRLLAQLGARVQRASHVTLGATGQVLT